MLKIKEDSRQLKIIYGLFFFIIYVAVQALFWAAPTTFVDENDVILGGMFVANGGDVYKHFLSQHMPLMYYFSALFHLLGAKTVIWYRVYFSVFSALLWILMYYRYKRFFGGWTMFLGPIIFIALLGMGDFTCVTILSDRMQAYGISILFMEFICFAKRENEFYNRTSIIWISFAILISFGSAFVSIFAIFAIFLSVFSLEICKNCISEKKTCRNTIIIITKKYYRLILVVLLPFIVLLGWYFLSSNLHNFFEGAYTMNREIYSKYLDGYGSSTIDSILSSISSFFSLFQNAIRGFNTDVYSNAMILLLLMINIAYLVRIFAWNKLTAVCTFFILTQSAPRGYTSFHAMGYYIITAYMAAELIGVLITQVRNIGPIVNEKKVGLIAGSLFILLTPLMANVSNVGTVAGSLLHSQISTEAKIIRQITDQDEPVGCLNAVEQEWLLVEIDRPIMLLETSVPWFYEQWGDAAKAKIEESAPAVVLYNPSYEVWGYAIKDYAAEICQEIENRYTNLQESGVGNLWVRNDCVEKVKKELGIVQYIQKTGDAVGICEKTLAGGQIFSQYFLAEVDKCAGFALKIGTYSRVSDASLELRLIDVDSNDVISSKIFELSSAHDNEYFVMEMPCTLVRGQQYRLDIQALNMDESNMVVPYITATENISEFQFAEIAGTECNYNLCVNLYL